MRRKFFGDLHRFARLRVASHARWAPGDREAAEPPNLDPATLDQRLGERIEQRAYCVLCIPLGQLGIPGSEPRDELRLRNRHRILWKWVGRRGMGRVG
jgi:hypothetical protein